MINSHDQAEQKKSSISLYTGFLSGGFSRGEGDWGTLIPREDWGTLGNIREDYGNHHPGPLRIL